MSYNNSISINNTLILTIELDKLPKLIQVLQSIGLLIIDKLKNITICLGVNKIFIIPESYNDELIYFVSEFDEECFTEYNGSTLFENDCDFYFINVDYTQFVKRIDDNYRYIKQYSNENDTAFIQIKIQKG